MIASSSARLLPAVQEGVYSTRCHLGSVPLIFYTTTVLPPASPTHQQRHCCSLPLSTFCTSCPARVQYHGKSKGTTQARHHERRWTIMDASVFSTSCVSSGRCSHLTHHRLRRVSMRSCVSECRFYVVSGWMAGDGNGRVQHNSPAPPTLSMPLPRPWLLRVAWCFLGCSTIGNLFTICCMALDYRHGSMYSTLTFPYCALMALLHTVYALMSP